MVVPQPAPPPSPPPSLGPEMDASIEAMGEPDGKFDFHITLNLYPAIFYLKFCYFSDVHVVNNRNQVWQLREIVRNLLAGKVFFFF